MNNPTSRIRVRYLDPKPGQNLSTWAGDKLNSGEYVAIYVHNMDMQAFSELVDLDPADEAAEDRYWEQERAQRLEKERKAFIDSITRARRNSSQELAALELEVSNLEQKQSELEAQWADEAVKAWEEHQAEKAATK